MKKALVTGAGGFIGGHLVKYLKKKGYNVTGVDIKYPEFEKTNADFFIISDLRKYDTFFSSGYFDEVYHLAASMGGIGFIESNRAEIMLDNGRININAMKMFSASKFLFTSSACVYPKYLQEQVNIIPLKEEEVFPAEAEEGYGWEKLMMELICKYVHEDFKVDVHVARLHNIYGINGAYQGGREKAPAALCRKIALADNEIEIWGDGTRTRSFCHVNDCVEGLYRLMQSDYHEPLNIGTDRLISINGLADMIIKISGKDIKKKHDITKWQGVVGRNADITKAKEILDWQPAIELEDGIRELYEWVEKQLSSGKK